ncbi:hypothetical protein [Streptomyces sp. NPDC002088]|uniref:hypothetical protein n=1 Tax=Streptomyces sp. NPDC002088 TaxID=3154665 RepID=UPI00332C1A39
MSDSTIDYAKVFTEAAEHATALKAREEALRAGTARDFDGLKALAAELLPEQKVALLEAMGFKPVGGDHDDDCVRRTHGSGFRCICVPPATMWSQPRDVEAYRKETWEDRRALAQQWSREGTHGREKDED